MPDLITPERLKTVVTAWYRSQRERMEMGENALIAWGAVPDLADEVERRTAEAEELRAEVDRLKAELAEMESAAADWAARLIEQRGRSGQAVSE